MLSSARQWWLLLARDANATQRPPARSRAVTASFGLERDGAPPVVLIVAGTRPECIKLAPLVRRLAGHDQLKMILVNSGQHCLAVRGTPAMRPVPIDERAPFGNGSAADKIVHVVAQTLLQRAYA